MQQCRQSQYTVQRIIETAGDDEALLFEALNVNDEIQKVLSKHEELRAPAPAPPEPEPAMIPVAVEPEEGPRAGREEPLVRRPPGSRPRGQEDEDVLQDLDEMIFGKKGGGPSAADGQEPGKKDDLIKF